MPFTPKTWVNDTTVGPFLEADELNRLEDGIDDAHDDIASLSLSKMPFVHPLKPTAAAYENFPRIQNNGLLTMTSGTMRMTPIWLLAGTTITAISFISGSTALVTGTHQWFALYDSSRNLLRQTTNDTSTAWAANATKTLNLTSTYPIASTGMYYIGINVTATTPPTIVAASIGGAGASSEPPILGGPSTAGLTGTAPNPAAAISASAVLPYCFVS